MSHSHWMLRPLTAPTVLTSPDTLYYNCIRLRLSSSVILLLCTVSVCLFVCLSIDLWLLLLSILLYSNCWLDRKILSVLKKRTFFMLKFVRYYLWSHLSILPCTVPSHPWIIMVKPGSQYNAEAASVVSIMRKSIFSLVIFYSWCQIFWQSDWANTGDSTLEQKSSLFQRHPNAHDATLAPVSYCEPCFRV